MVDVSPIVVVVNPTAGRGRAGRLVGKITASLRELRLDHEIRVAGSAAETESACRSAGEAGAPIVVAVGGDGTASRAANGLLGTDAALAIIPAGTGDDLATALGVHRYERAVRALADPRIVRIDVGRVRTGSGEAARHFLNIAGAGFDSEVNETANGMRRSFGATGTYIVALVKTLRRFAPAHLEVDAGEERWSGDAMLVAIGNGRSYGGGMKVTPDASMTDGLFDVCVIGALSKPAFLRAFPSVFRGRHTRHPAVRTLRASEVHLDANRQILLYADGERIGPLPAVLDVLPGALPVVVGPSPRGIG